VEIIEKYAPIAKQAWQDFVKARDNRQRICNYFHLRPTNKGITVVTTLNNYEMRGVRGIKNAENLIALLEKIDKNYEVLTSLNNEKKKKEIMKDLGFPQRRKANDSKSEEKIQATMINTMSKDKNLRGKLGAKDYIRFIASELIFEQGKHRVDIVGFDGKTIYFFELKKGRTLKAKQLYDYVNYYNNKRVILEKLLKTYPINSVDSFKHIQGVMVMEYADNSVELKAWQELAKESGIRIVFYKPSLTYENIA